MKNSVKTVCFLDRVESIHVKFMESLITGERDAIFRDPRRDEAPPPMEQEDSEALQLNLPLD